MTSRGAKRRKLGAALLAVAMVPFWMICMVVCAAALVMLAFVMLTWSALTGIVQRTTRSGRDSADIRLGRTVAPAGAA